MYYTYYMVCSVYIYIIIYICNNNTITISSTVISATIFTISLISSIIISLLLLSSILVNIYIYMVGGFKHVLFSISYMGCHPSH